MVVGLGLYVVAIGAPTSAVRAFMMVAAVVGAHLLYRPGSGLSGLALAALVILAWRPGTVSDLGFQFSFAATGAILLFLTHMPGVLEQPSTTPFARPSAAPPWLRYTGQSVGVSVVASLAIWPVTLAHFGTVSLAGIHMSPIPEMDYDACLFHEKQLRSVEANTREDGRELLREAAEIPVRPETTTYPLAEANAALRDLKESRIDGTGVLVPDA